MTAEKKDETDRAENARRITIADVARRAQVSATTVSHVINATASISAHTQQKVNDAIRELNFKPNTRAHGTRQKQTKAIGLILPSVQSAFYAGCANGILQAADEQDYTALLCDSGYDLAREQHCLDALIGRQVDGLIFLGGVGDERIIRAARTAKIPIVLCDRAISGYSSVEFMNAKFMKQLVKTLYNQGKRRFCYVTEPIGASSLQIRCTAFREGLRMCKIAANQSVVLIDKQLQEEKIQTAQLLLEEYFSRKNPLIPDVILTSCDQIAIGVMNALREKGFRVPEQIGVIGFGNSIVSPYTLPPLTTVSQNACRMGQQSFAVLMDLMHGQMDGQMEKPTHIMIESELVMRGSI